MNDQCQNHFVKIQIRQFSGESTYEAENWVMKHREIQAGDYDSRQRIRMQFV